MSNSQKTVDEKTLDETKIKTLDEKDLKVIKGSWGCSITWNHRSFGGGGGIIPPIPGPQIP